MINGKKIFIIGGGISGLVAALEAVKNGAEVTLIEASPYLGGRCRAFFDPKLDCVIDNGNHLLLGANKGMLEFIEPLGQLENFQKIARYDFFDFELQKRWNMKSDLGIVGLLYSIVMLTLRKAKWKNSEPQHDIHLPHLDSSTSSTFQNDDKKNKTVFQAIGNSSLYDSLWKNLCISIMNTNPAQANFGMFRKVVWEILKTKAGMVGYFPQENWQQNLIEPLTNHLTELGVDINLKNRVKNLDIKGKRINNIELGNKNIEIGKNDSVILATPWQEAASLLPEIISKPVSHSAIINVHFKYDYKTISPIIGITKNEFLEWIFIKDGIISTTSSAANKLMKLSNDEIIKNIWQCICVVLELKSVPIPNHRIIIEKRASFSADVENISLRPDIRTKYDNLFLAGDYVANNLPATLEGAYLNGASAAELSLAQVSNYPAL